MTLLGTTIIGFLFIGIWLEPTPEHRDKSQPEAYIVKRRFHRSDKLLIFKRHAFGYLMRQPRHSQQVSQSCDLGKQFERF